MLPANSDHVAGSASQCAWSPKGYLPKERTEICELEYNQVDFAYRTLIVPLMDASR